MEGRVDLRLRVHNPAEREGLAEVLYEPEQTSVEQICIYSIVEQSGAEPMGSGPPPGPGPSPQSWK